MTSSRTWICCGLAIAFGSLIVDGNFARAQRAAEMQTRGSLDENWKSKAREIQGSWSAKAFKDATINLMTGKFVQARAEYDSALAAATNQSKKQLTTVKWINLLSRTSRTQTGNPSLQLAVETEYRKLMSAPSPEVRRLAGNNLGFTLLQGGRNQEALATLRLVEPDYASLQDGFAKAGYFYNLGLANERQGDIPTSLQHYKTAALADPKFQPPLRAVLRNLAKLSPGRGTSAKLDTWIGIAIDRKDYRSAKQSLLNLISGAVRNPRTMSGPMVALILRYFTATGTSPDQYGKDWEENMAMSFSGDPRLKRIHSEIRHAYFDTYPIEFGIGSEGSGRRFFRAILNEKLGEKPLATVSEFLKAVGDTMIHNEEYEGALQRYATAWSLNTEDFDAALASAYLLVEQKPSVDPRGRHMQRLVEQLFAGKGEAYIGGQTDKIFRFHTTLGSIFVRQREWGADGKITGAIFQLENAIEAHARLARENNIEAAPIPVLRRNLAIAFKETNQNRKAYGRYLDAADDALKLGNTNLARLSLKEAKSLSSAASTRQKRRYEMLERRI